MTRVQDQHLHSQHLLHSGTPRIHILDAGLSLYPWEHRHSLKQKGKSYKWAVLKADYKKSSKIKECMNYLF